MALFRRDRTPAVREPVEVLEQRDPLAATKSLTYTSYGRPVPPDWNATRAFEIAVYSNVVVYACFQAIANEISALPFRAGPDPDKPSNYNPQSPLTRLLGSPPGGPNPGMSAEELWYFAIVQYLATGRFGWEIETATGSKTPVALWPLVSANLVPVPSELGTGWFKGFEYGRPYDARKLNPDQVLYCWQPRGTDFRQPESALEAAHLDISIAVMQSKYDYAFLKNDARPAALIVTEAFADQDDKVAFEQQWNSAYGGPDNAGKVVVLEAEGDEGVTGAVDVKVLGLSPKDAQAAQRYSDRLQQIAIGLGVPWSRLDASGRTFANASEEDKIWWRQRLRPLVRRLQSAINIQLAPRLGTDVGWFDLRGVEALRDRPDPVSAQVGAPALVQAQIMTVNEARADYGLPAIEGGDRMMTAEEIAALKSTTPVAMSATPEVREVPATSAPVQAVEPPAPLPAVIPEDRGETLEEAEARRTKVWNANDSTVRNLERVFQRRMERLFARQLRSVIARLEHKRSRRVAGEVRALADEVFDPQHWIVETADEMRVLYEQVMIAAGAKMASRFGIAFDLDAAYVEEFIAARANQLAGNVTETTYRAIQEALTEGVASGEGIPELAARVRHVFDVASKSRATTIARTETISAYNGAGTSVASAYGEDVVAGQEWIATRDARTRDAHIERDGEIVQIGEPFSGGLAYPGDPSAPPAETVNCRCTVAYLTPEEMASRAARSVPISAARALFALVKPGAFDERAMRAALTLVA